MTLLVNKDYLMQEEIASGTFGKIYKGVNLKYNQPVAIKTMKKSDMGTKLAFNAETGSLQQLMHPNITQMYDFFEDDDKYYIIFEYYPKTLAEYLNNCHQLGDPSQKKHPFSEMIYCLCGDILNGLIYIHEMGFSHRDIKTANIMIDNFGRAKIIDFGFCKKFDKGEMTASYSGSPAFWAPELVMKLSHDPYLSDIWALGVVFYEMVTLRIPWNGNTFEEMKKQILDGYFMFPDSVPNEMKRVICTMLAVKPENRGKMSEMISNPIFQKNRISCQKRPSDLGQLSVNAKAVRSLIFNGARCVRRRSSIASMNMA